MWSEIKLGPPHGDLNAWNSCHLLGLRIKTITVLSSQFTQEVALAQGQYVTRPRSHGWYVTQLAWTHLSLHLQSLVALLPCSAWGL